MVDVIIIVVLLGVVGVAVSYIVKEKKKGAKCIGCPAGNTCAQKCSGNCSGCKG